MYTWVSLGEILVVCLRVAVGGMRGSHSKFHWE